MRGLLTGTWMVATAAMLTACGGGGDGSSPPPAPSATPTPSPVPVPGLTACTLRSRQDWAAAQLREWYLFPETLPASLDPSPYSTADAYVDALTATARGQGRDRYFTYLTSIAEENAYYSSGSDVGLGVRFATDPAQRRLFVLEAFEGSPALNAGIDRGAEVLAIGTTTANLRTVSAIATAEGLAGVEAALGPDTDGTVLVLRIADAGGTRNVTVTKRAFELTPVSSRYGSRIIDYSGHRIGYVNLRTFISTADPALRNAFAQFRAQGVTEIVVDLRYNGGGLVSIAELLGDLMGGGRTPSDVFSYMTYRPEKSAQNRTHYFASQPQSIAPTRVAFIGTGSTASASELVINGFIPYLGDRAVLVGGNTYGKPVGQIAIDRAECDDRLRVIAFKTENSARAGDYYNGIASSVRVSCRSEDDIGYPLGDAREAMTRQALDFIVGGGCTPIGSATAALRSDRVGVAAERALLMPDRPRTAQREVPGLF
ncbi:MAG: S41 family peptidase [Sphingobium sp.]